jgi:serine protease Do
MRSGIATLVGIACLLPHPGFALEANEIFKRADPSIVVISTTDKNGKDLALGSGVLLTPRDVVTNCHVLKDAVGIAVRQPGVQRSAKLRYQDTARDLCQILLDDALPAGKPVSALLPSAKLEVGQPVYAIGAPQGLDRTLSRGIISALRDMKENAKLIQTDASITNGSSGGGLFDSEGRLIGIVTFGVGAEGNLNFAIPTDWIEQLAARNRDRSTDAAAASAPATSAVAPASDGRWYPAKGDRWNYRLLDGRRPMGIVSVEVTDASNGRVRERITKEGSKEFSVERETSPEFTTNAFLPTVVLPGGYRLLELSAYFPPDASLASGTLRGQIPGELELLGHGKRKVVWNARVAGQERVQVPAGEFQAWKIEATSETDTRHGLMKFTYRIWYSQAMQRAVKIFLDINSPLNIEKSTESLELANFGKGS